MHSIRLRGSRCRLVIGSLSLSLSLSVVTAASSIAQAGEREQTTWDLWVYGDNDYSTEARLGIGLSVGNVDNDDDGNVDVLMGASYASPGGATYAGEAYVLLGPDSGSYEADDLIRISGVNAGEGVGYALDMAGDFDADGYDDIALGAWHYSVGVYWAGRVYLFYGPLTASTTVSAADATFTGSAELQEVGGAVASGDLNADGYDDLVIGARGDEQGGSDAGAVYGFAGGSTRYSGDYTVGGASGDEDWAYLGDPGDDAGASVAALLTEYHDGGTGAFYDRLVVGAPDHSSGTESLRGAVYLLFIGPPPSGDLSDEYTVSANIVEGDSAGDWFGIRVASGGDSYTALSSTGIDELLVGTYICTDHAGKAYLFDGFRVLDEFFTEYASDAQAIFTADQHFSCGETTVGGAGDVDGDGSDDVLVGDVTADVDFPSSTVEGAAYLFYGPIPGNANLSAADVVFSGGADGDHYGYQVAAGDINIDGKSDVLVAAPDDDYVGSTGRGSVSLFYGPFDPIAGLYNLSESDTILEGDDADDQGGYAVAAVGDIDCDGVQDVAVGALRADQLSAWTGAVYFFLGPTPDDEPLRWEGEVVDLGQADGVFYGALATDWTGGNLDFAGDIDGDGCDDVLIPATGNDGAGSDAGVVYLLYGSPSFGGTMHPADADARFRGDSAGDYFGRGASGLGDLDGDGNADFAIGARGDNGAQTDSGRAFLFYGRDSSDPWSGTNAASDADCIFNGEATDDWAGYAFAGPVSLGGGGTDFDGDAYLDVIMSAPQNNRGGTDAGAIYVFYGSSSRCSGTYAMSAADGIIVGPDTCGFGGGVGEGHLGHSLAGAGDIDADGYDDLVAGAPYSEDRELVDPPDICDVVATEVGRVYWIPGQNLSGSTTAPAGGASFRPPASNSVRLGWAVDAGDVTGDAADVGMGDGVAELVMGAPLFSTGAVRRGQTFLFYGSTVAGLRGSGQTTDNAELKLRGEYGFDFSGWSVAVTGDLNQEGERDVLVGAYGSDRGGSLSGAAYLVLASH